MENALSAMFLQRITIL